MLISLADYAKYPFTIEAAEFVKQWDINIGDFSGPYSTVLDRAEERVKEALIEGEVSWSDRPEYEVEILSHPTSVLLVSAINDPYLKRRYALSEARRAYLLLNDEDDDEKIINITNNSFKWNVRKIDSKYDLKYFDFTISFIDYLKHAPKFHAEEWKLVNRTMHGGNVFLNKKVLIRLMEEEVREHIEERIDSSPRLDLPEIFNERMDRIGSLLSKFKEKFISQEEILGVVPEVFPPCIRILYSALLAKHHLSHMGRFTVTSFLLNIGMQPEELIKLYLSLSDFNERLTRYQVMHIAGEKGSKIKYTPPTCNTLRTHGLCIGKDEICNSVNHPLAYYRKMLPRLRSKEEVKNE
jgi:DNA primase large subunit